MESSTTSNRRAGKTEQEHTIRPREHLAAIDQALTERFGDPSSPNRRPALDELVLTILSQNTTSTNTRRAYDAMRAQYPDWADVLAAPQADLEALLRPGGLAPTKAVRIQRILAELAKRGPLSLDFLDGWETEAIEQWLLELDGVGYKTARCVLLFALGRDAFPVDTHILRILKRVGLLSETRTLEQAHRDVAANVPQGRSYSLHVNLIRLGRTLCRPQKPKCAECPLLDLCAYGQNNPGT